MPESVTIPVPPVPPDTTAEAAQGGRNVTATCTGPSEYVVNVTTITRGIVFTARGIGFWVVGEPVRLSRAAVGARARQLNGPGRGTEFAAYLLEGQR